MHRAMIPTIVLLTAIFATSGAAWHSEMPVVHQETVEGTEGAWGLHVDLPETGDFVVEIEGNLADGVDRSGIGGVTFDSAGNAGSRSIVAFFNAPDRVVLHEESVPGTGEIHHVGGTPGFDGQFYGLGVTERDAPAGVHSYGFWMGGMDNITLTVTSDVDAEVTTKRGTAHTHGDPSFTDSGTNVQAQAPGPLPLLSPTPGVKHMDDAALEVQVEHELFGMFATFGAEESCQVTADGTCVPVYLLADEGATIAEEACEDRTGEDCGAVRAALNEETGTRISWEGPQATGADESWYDFRQAPGGDYTFTVDQKTDHYAGPVVQDAENGVFVRDDEDLTLFVAADIGLPS